MFGSLGLPELLVIGGIVFLIWGGTKFPKMMKGFGEGIRLFRKEVRDMSEED